MSDTVIQVENLGKKYTLGQQQQGNSRYVALRDVMADSARSFSRRLRHPFKSQPRPNQEEFWALKDVSFEVKQGEVVGIIGRNGAGKSTLLKILSRITEPTEGRVRLRGRVASLLEVGTGFHPELTGRENIFLNGAILGMSRAEINHKFDEIVEFAEVSRFLDTPVKRYSSGMYVRLAFAVAAHLEPEILVIDEVLAVGDIEFQKRCIGKMKNIASKQGKTLLFVSHNLATIEQLCNRAILLNGGTIKMDGHPKESISFYLKDLKNQETTSKSANKTASLNLSICDSNRELNVVQCGKDITIDVVISCFKKLPKAGFGIGIMSPNGERVATLHSHFQYNDSWSLTETCHIRIQWPENFLAPQTYQIIAALYDSGQLIDHWDNVGSLSVVASDFFGTGKLPDTTHQGYTLAKASWTIDSLPIQKNV